MTDSPTKMAMNTIVCHIGAMSGRGDERESRLLSAAVVLGATVGGVKGCHLPARSTIHRGLQKRTVNFAQLRSDRCYEMALVLIGPLRGFLSVVGVCNS